MVHKNGYPLARCRVSGGAAGEKVPTCMKKLNFPRRVDLLINRQEGETLASEFTDLAVKCYLVRSSFGSILNEALLNLVRSKDVSVKLVLDTKKPLNSIFVSIVNNRLCLTLDRNLSLRTGINMAQSNFKSSQLKNFVLDLESPTLLSDINFLKLLRFFQSLDGMFEAQDFVLQLFKNGEPIVFDEDFLLHLGKHVEQVVPLDIGSKITHMSNVAMANLQIQEQDPDWSIETLEYLSYLSINGEQLSSTVDSFLSQYRESTDLPTQEDVISITFESKLVPAHSILHHLISKNLKGWFAIIMHGIENTNYSFGLSEHIVHESGENSVCYLQKDGKFAVWEIVGGQDNH